MALLFLTLITALSFIYAGNCSKEDVCQTEGCKEASKNILESLNKNINPCDNFYRFACGNTLKKNAVIPGDKTIVNNFIIIGDKITEQLHKILEEPIDKDEIRPITLVKKYYQACMNEEYIEKNGIKILKDLLKSLGGWPVLEGDSWDEKNFEWTKLMYKLKKSGLGFKSFFELTVDPDFTNSNVYIVQIDQPEFGLSREFFTTNKYIETYLELMVNILVELGADRLIAKKDFNESVEFEKKLATISLSDEDRSDITKFLNYMTINEMEEKYKGTPWLEVINNFLPPEVQLKGDDKILVIVPTYFSAFAELIQKTPKRLRGIEYRVVTWSKHPQFKFIDLKNKNNDSFSRTVHVEFSNYPRNLVLLLLVLANYALWRSIQNIASMMPKNVYQHILAATRVVSGQAERKPRWKECTVDATARLPLLVSSLYVRKYFDEDAKKNATEIVDYIRNAFKDILNKLDWMDEVTRGKALVKAEKMAQHIGYPDELLNDTLLEKHYQKLETDAEQYLKSYLNVSVDKTDFEYRRLPNPVDKADWTEHGTTVRVQAVYNPLENSIFFAAGILQGIFFNKNRPRYLNFAGIGSVIGHEITHGFDDSGRQFDENGNVVNWWEDATEKAFLNKTLCMIYQYGNYTVPEIMENINGIKTLSENIADNGGLKEAYLAYNAWVNKNEPEPRLPNLDYSPNQLFWISAAMNWCTNYKDQYLRSVVSIDTHSPDEFRVVGTFSNSEEFANDFNCPSGSKMNPVHKCSVW